MALSVPFPLPGARPTTVFFATPRSAGPRRRSRCWKSIPTASMMGGSFQCAREPIPMTGWICPLLFTINLVVSRLPTGIQISINGWMEARQSPLPRFTGKACRLPHLRHLRPREILPGSLRTCRHPNSEAPPRAEPETKQNLSPGACPRRHGDRRQVVNRHVLINDLQNVLSTCFSKLSHVSGAKGLRQN